MAAYHQVYDDIVCRLTAYGPRSAPDPILVTDYEKLHLNIIEYQHHHYCYCCCCYLLILFNQPFFPVPASHAGERSEA